MFLEVPDHLIDELKQLTGAVVQEEIEDLVVDALEINLADRREQKKEEANDAHA